MIFNKKYHILFNLLRRKLFFPEWKQYFCFSGVKIFFLFHENDLKSSEVEHGERYKNALPPLFGEKPHT